MRPPPRCRGKANAPAYAAAAALQLGEHFVWPEAPAHWRALVKKWSGQLRYELRAFVSIDGETIVERRDPEDFVEEEEKAGEAGADHAGGDDDEGDDDDPV